MCAATTMQTLADGIAVEGDAAKRLFGLADLAETQGASELSSTIRSMARSHQVRAIALRARLDAICYFYMSGHVPDPS